MSTIEEETLEAIKSSGHGVSDIKFIGSLEGYACTWSEFQELAKQGDVHYYGGFGGQTLAEDLIIMFNDDTYMKRGEYDGSEWWEFNPPVVLPENPKPIKSICNGDSWASVAEMSKSGDKYGSTEVDEDGSTTPTTERTGSVSGTSS